MTELHDKGMEKLPGEPGETRDELARALARDARRFRRPPALAARVIERLEERPPRPPSRLRARPVLALAASLVVGGLALALFHDLGRETVQDEAVPGPAVSAAPLEPGTRFTMPSVERLDALLAGSRGLLGRNVDEPLRAEWRAWSVDAGRTADAILEGLPRPVRELAAPLRPR